MNIYVPKVGDVIIDKEKNVVVISILNNEEVSSCSYDREYLLCEEEKLNLLITDTGVVNTKVLRAASYPIKVKGLYFPPFTKVPDVAPYEITSIQMYAIRRKTPKLSITYE